jgi:hypothetical protein
MHSVGGRLDAAIHRFELENLIYFVEVLLLLSVGNALDLARVRGRYLVGLTGENVDCKIKEESLLFRGLRAKSLVRLRSRNLSSFLTVSLKICYLATARGSPMSFLGSLLSRFIKLN